MLNPLLLWFVPLALVPVLLHLMTRRRLQTLELSTFRFLMDSYLQQRRRLRLLEWLVMALRVGFILLIVFVLARPVVQGVGFLGSSEGGRDVTLILDAGPTMALRSDGTSSHQRAIGAANQILDRLADNDHVRVIRAGAEPTVLSEGYASRRQPLRRALEGLELEARTPDLAAAIDRALDASARGVRSIYIITDAMARTWAPAAGRSRALERVALHQPITVLDVGPDAAPANVAVIGEPPEALRVVRGLPLLLDATVVNQGPHATDTTLSLVLGEQRLAQANLSLAPGQHHTHRFTVRPPESGLVEGRFEVPGSAFAADDVYRFTLGVSEHIEVGIVFDGAAHAQRPRRERPGLYLDAALAAEGSDDHGIASDPDTRRLAEAVRVRALAPDELHDEQALAGIDVLLLADVPMDAERGARLRRYVERGGGLVIFPGPDVDPEAYNDHLFAPRRGDALPMRLGEPVGDSMGDTGGTASARAIAHVERSHPVLRVFDEPHYFSSVHVSRRFAIASAQADRGARVLLALEGVGEGEGGDALLSEAALGRGRVLVMGVPATPGWSNLPLQPEFVPLLLRAALHAQRPADAIAPAVVRPGQPAPVHLTERWPNARVTAIGPDGDEHTINLHRAPGQRVGAMRATQRVGYYRIEVLPGDEAAPDRLELGFAVNPEPDEAGLAGFGEADFRAALAPAEVVALRGSPDDPLLAQQLDARQEIWRTLIWLTLAVIGLEFLLATLRPRPTAAEQAAAASTGWRHWGRWVRTTLNPLPD